MFASRMLYEIMIDYNYACLFDFPFSLLQNKEMNHILKKIKQGLFNMKIDEVQTKDD